jgi:putative acetyltransferase
VIRGLVIREVDESDRAAIRDLVSTAFGQNDEARLVDALVADGDAVLELVALHEGGLVGHVLFSRLVVEGEETTHDAIALAPVAVAPHAQKTGIGISLVEHAHGVLALKGETLSIVLGDPAYYARFGYTHARAAGFSSDYQSEALQALAFGAAPEIGRLRYASAFSAL